MQENQDYFLATYILCFNENILMQIIVIPFLQYGVLILKQNNYKMGMHKQIYFCRLRNSLNVIKINAGYQTVFRKPAYSIQRSLIF